MIARRDFITVLGGAAAWPLVARAQQAAVPVIGLLGSESPNGAFAAPLRAFHQGLSEVGFVEGRNAAIEYRWAEGQYDQLPTLAADLIRRQVAVIVTTGGALAAFAAKAATKTTPIVLVVGADPVKIGLVAGLNRPGGNLTGAAFVTGELGGKRLDLLSRVVPEARTIACLIDPRGADTETEKRDILTAANAVGRHLIVLEVQSERDLAAAFSALAQKRVGALVVGSEVLFNSVREELVALAARYKIPTIYSERDFAAAGGLLSYGASRTDPYHQVGVYAGRILKGEKPADLPVLQPTKFELLINLKTAKALGLTVSRDMQLIADEVIE
jgi:putative ABC transport system substrate-binding protein